VAVGGGGVRLESPDGAAWTLRDSGTENDLFGVRLVGDRLLAIGKAGTVLRETCDANRSSRVRSFR
ncbi:MAG: hypothetical protein ABJC28_04195, partial [Acidobacteriota bacterium]